MNNVTRCDICGGPMNALDRGLCDRCLSALLADPESLEEESGISGQESAGRTVPPSSLTPDSCLLTPDKPEPETVYDIAVAFAGKPFCETRGQIGLMETMPQLEPGLYMIHARGKLIADATRHEDGSWKVEFYSGVVLTAGCIIV